MEFWYTEEHTKNVRLSLKIDRQIVNTKSAFQQIDVFDSPEFGRVLTLDGCLMVTEKDEFIYHEMIVHIPMAVNPDIKKVLVIGAGDGGTVQISNHRRDSYGRNRQNGSRYLYGVPSIYC